MTHLKRSQASSPWVAPAAAWMITSALFLLIGLGMGACSSENNATSATSGQGGATPSSGAEGANNQGGSNQGGSNQGGSNQGGSNQGSDNDGDGFKTPEDCNDNNKDVNPAAKEICDNSIDDNCNGAIDSAEPDQDGDGFGPCSGDCDDSNKDISPAATEIDGDMIDNNCDGIVDGDFDGDGVTTQDGDCDDTNPDVKPGIKENCFDGIDNNCNMAIDAAEPDADMDGYGPCAGDCDDSNKDVNPGAKEIPNNGIDDNCDNLVDADIDGDGWTVQNGDCNDNDPTVNPSVLEVCGDNIDNDCDTIVDTDCLTKCDLANLIASSVGCEYYAIDTDNFDSHDSFPYAVVVSNTDAVDTATVQVQTRSGNNWNTIQSQMVAPSTLHQFNLPSRHMNNTGIKTEGAYRIVSDTPIIAYQFQPVNGQSSFSSDASLLLPTSALDKFYMVAGWGTNSYREAQIVMVATEDGTVVQVKPTINTAGGGGINTITAGQTVTLPTMNAGDFIQINAANKTSSFNGTEITSNKSIGVFSAHICANVPGLPTCCCDHLEEQLAGLQTWGKNYLAAHLPIRKTSGNPGPNQWHVVASENNTTVTFVANGQVTGLPAGPQVLSKGQALFLQVGGTQANPGDFLVAADKPIFVMQYMSSGQSLQGVSAQNGGDPAMNQAVPVEQFLDNYVVLAPPNWVNDYFVITKAAGQTVSIDGNLVAQNEFTKVGSSNWEVARVKTSDGVHKLSGSQPFGVTVVGFDSYDSYSYPGGLNQKIINPKN